MQIEKYNKFIFVAVMACICVYVFLFIQRPIFDPDFWWHIASGRIFLETKGFMDKDVFSIRSEFIDVSRENLILKGYWLWQVIEYIVFSKFSEIGIRVFNLIIFLSVIATYIYVFIKNKINYLASIFFISIFVYISMVHLIVERPQIFSFIFMLLILLFVDRSEESGRLSFFIIPLIILWANVHPGVFLVIILLLSYLLYVIICSKGEQKNLKKTVPVCLLGIAASQVNPYGIDLFYSLIFKPSYSTDYISEYMNVFEYFSLGNDEKIVVVIMLLCFVAYCFSFVILFKEMNFTNYFVFFLALFGILYARNYGFLYISALPIISVTIYRATKLKKIKYNLYVYLNYISIVLLVAGALSFGYFDEKYNKNTPSGLVNELKNISIDGNIFNNYDVGGYLIYNFPFDGRYFIDNRQIDTYMFNLYMNAQTMGKINFEERINIKEIFEKYDISVVVNNNFQKKGGLNSLLKEVINYKNWYPVYIDKDWHILKKVEKTNGSKNLMSKIEFLNKALNHITNEVNLGAGRNKLIAHLSRADLYGFLGNYKLAKSDIEMASKIDSGYFRIQGIKNNIDVLSSRN